TAATPSVSYTLTSMWGVGHLMNGGGRTWAVRATFRGVTPVNTSAIVEFVLPPNVLRVGERARFNQVTLPPNCSIIYSGITPIRYRCIVAHPVGTRDLFQHVVFDVPPGTPPSIDVTATVIAINGLPASMVTGTLSLTSSSAICHSRGHALQLCYLGF
ncbi:MAG: hypothetical protein ABMA00_11245, partial [Gemmatimonas sp.]